MTKPMWLLVEDDPIIRSILTALMTLWGVDSLVFKDGHQAFRWLDQIEKSDPAAKLPDIGLLDIRMPGANGHEIGKRMRSLSATKDIPIVIMTAYQLPREERNQIQEMARPEHIIGKPLPAPDDLRRMLEKTVADSQKNKVGKQVKLSVQQPQFRYLVNTETGNRVAAIQVAKRSQSKLTQASEGDEREIRIGVPPAPPPGATKPLNLTGAGTN
jgi:CheY-like chemotaxis protein